MTEITCLRCHNPIDSEVEQCPSCGERVTNFQRTYAARLIDGKYQIVDRLGAGGMGEIFKVRHIHLNELRVIKIMRPNVASDDQGLQRFLQEARTSTMIKQRNLAMLYDFAQLDDGSYYMVWEFIDGTNIQKWMATSGAMPARLVIEIAIQALVGLDHLHSMGLIHRDVSPENIMLSQERGGKLLVKVIDFGIAKQLTEGEGGQGLTQTGMFLGKLKYASPEQAGFLKEGEHIDARSDLYSFGIVMYEMLAGRAPFQATNPHGYILKHVTEKPAAIGVISPGISVPPQLEAIIFKSLEKDRNDRYASAADFAKALEAIRDSVTPDSKYGVGEKMVTLSSEKTLADISARGTITPFGKQTTLGTGPRTTAGTRSAGDQATVIERGSGPSRTAAGTPGMQATVAERAGANEKTVMERVGGAAPTASEKKFGPATAEPTVLERKFGTAAQPPKSNVARIAAIAAAVMIVLGIGGYFVFRPHVDQSGGVTKVDTTVSQKPLPPPPAGQGILLLSASPWGDLEKIVNAGNNKAIDLSDEKRSTPTSIELAAGKYLVTVNGPNGQQTTIDVEIKAGERKRMTIPMGNVDYDQVMKDMNQK